MLVLFDKSIVSASGAAQPAVAIEPKRLTLAANAVTTAVRAPCECGGHPC